MTGRAVRDWRSRGRALLYILPSLLVLALIYVALTLLSDLMNAVLDPRLRAQ